MLSRSSGMAQIGCLANSIYNGLQIELEHIDKKQKGIIFIIPF